MTAKKGKFTGGGYKPPIIGPAPAEPPSALASVREVKADFVPRESAEKKPVHTARLQVLVTPEAERAFRMLQVETGRKGPDLMVEALNLLFAKHGREKV